MISAVKPIIAAFASTFVPRKLMNVATASRTRANTMVLFTVASKPKAAATNGPPP